VTVLVVSNEDGFVFLILSLEKIGISVIESVLSEYFYCTKMSLKTQ